MPIKSFRGLIADGAIDTITLRTNNGSTGYRITKFELMPNRPGKVRSEHIVKIFKIPQSTPTTETVDFSDNTLLAAGIITNQTDANDTYSSRIIFDQEIFNQDIFVTNFDDTGNEAVNYYIELEQVRLSLDENTVATLKDIRNIKSNE
tara:strand:+ start:18 stop:461 length:444 start_codon:yes stop_codon:yes gene_type:complete